MRIAVGSANPVKRSATERAMGDVATEVTAIDVDSGVSEQPWGDGETIAGAETRAARARTAGSYDLGVGIEGGVADLALADADALFLIMWAAVTDGSTVGLGAGPRLPLPDDVAQRLEDGEELGPVMDDRLDAEGIAREEGAVGVLTDGIVTREDALFQAVAGAFGRFVSGEYN